DDLADPPPIPLRRLPGSGENTERATCQQFPKRRPLKLSQSPVKALRSDVDQDRAAVAERQNGARLGSIDLHKPRRIIRHTSSSAYRRAIPHASWFSRIAPSISSGCC